MSALEDQVKQAQADFDEGKTVEDLAEEPEQIPPMQIPLEGFGDSITSSPGGLRPTSSSVVLRGGKLPVEGEFKKGTEVELLVRCRVADVSYPDTHDEYGQPISCERRHTLKLMAVRRLSSED